MIVRTWWGTRIEMRINNSRRLSLFVCWCVNVNATRSHPSPCKNIFLKPKIFSCHQIYFSWPKIFTPSQCRRKTRWRSPADPRQSARGRMSWGGAPRSVCWAARPPSGPWHSVWITWTSWLWPLTARCSRPSAGSCLTSVGPMSEKWKCMQINLF